MLHINFVGNHNNHLILNLFLEAAKISDYRNKWLSDKDWVNVIEERFMVPEALKFTVQELSLAIGRNGNLKI
jgi:hypothetical protein